MLFRLNINNEINENKFRIKITNRDMKQIKTFLIETDIYDEFKIKCIDNDSDASKTIRKFIKEYINWRPRYDPNNFKIEDTDQMPKKNK